MERVRTALQRVEAALKRRPDWGRHEDAPATAVWEGDTAFRVAHDNGFASSTDMPTELGGEGKHVTPGWLFRASVASCAGTSIYLAAVAAGVALQRLQVRVESQSDVRGLLGMAEADGTPVLPGTAELQLHVSICAAGVADADLRALIDTAMSRSPIPAVVRAPTGIALNVVVEQT